MHGARQSPRQGVLSTLAAVLLLRAADQLAGGGAAGQKGTAVTWRFENRQPTGGK